MPFDSEGNFSRLHNWEDDRINDIDIVTDHMDEEDNNFANGLSQCFLKNGLSKMQGDINVNHFKIRNLANASSSSDAINKSQLDALRTTITPSLVPTGTILPFGGTTAPNGYLLCDGTAVSRTTYADLFAVIGTAYGIGDGSTTFNVPNGADRSLWGNTQGYVESGLPDHSHTVTYNGSYQSVYGWGSGSDAMTSSQTATTSNASSSNAIYGKTDFVRPQSIGVYYIIKC